MPSIWSVCTETQHSFKELNIKAHKKCTTNHKDQNENSKSKREKQQKTTSLILEIAKCCQKNNCALSKEFLEVQRF